MLSKKKQAKYLKKRSQKILDLLDQFSQKQEPEILHKIRVEIKKTKAYLEMSASCSDKQKIPRSIKEFFKKAGAIRSAYLNLEFIKRYRLNNPQLKNDEEKRAASQIKEFSANIKQYRKAVKKIPGYFEKNLQAIKNNCIESWYKKELEKAVHVFNTFAKSELHQCRKLIKNLLYVHQMLAGFREPALILNMEYLDKIQEAIGKWHDTDVAAKLLTPKEDAGKKVTVKFNREISKNLSAIKKLCKKFSTRVSA